MTRTCLVRLSHLHVHARSAALRFFCYSDFVRLARDQLVGQKLSLRPAGGYSRLVEEPALGDVIGRDREATVTLRELFVTFCKQDLSNGRIKRGDRGFKMIALQAAPGCGKVCVCSAWFAVCDMFSRLQSKFLDYVGELSPQAAQPYFKEIERTLPDILKELQQAAPVLSKVNSKSPGNSSRFNRCPSNVAGPDETPSMLGQIPLSVRQARRDSAHLQLHHGLSGRCCYRRVRPCCAVLGKVTACVCAFVACPHRFGCQLPRQLASAHNHRESH